MRIDSVSKIICDTLKSISLEKDYESEEKGLQPHLKRAIMNAFSENRLDDYKTKISVGGKNRPRIDLLGTNFWPDIEISKNGEPLIAVEVKYEKKSLPNALSSLLGQCLIYKLKYKFVIGFILHRGSTNSNYEEYDHKFWTMIEELDLSIIIRS